MTDPADDRRDDEESQAAAPDDAADDPDAGDADVEDGGEDGSEDGRDVPEDTDGAGQEGAVGNGASEEPADEATSEEAGADEDTADEEPIDGGDEEPIGGGDEDAIGEGKADAGPAAGGADGDGQPAASDDGVTDEEVTGADEVGDDGAGAESGGEAAGDETDDQEDVDEESVEDVDGTSAEDADEDGADEGASADDDADPWDVPPKERRDDWEPPEDYEPAEVPAPEDESTSDDEDDGIVGTAASVAESAGGSLMDAEVGHAPDDEEQPLEVHVTEMVHRFLAVAIAMGGVATIALLWSDDLINFLWYSFLGPGAPLCPGQECPDTFRPHLYHPLSLVLARLKVAVLVGFVVGLPVAVYQTYLFMRPGLYPRERRYYLAAVPTSLVLAAVGVAFAYFLILPALFSYFVSYTAGAAEPALGLAETFNIMVILLGFFALVFQIPLLVMLAVMMGVTTRRWLENRRLYFWMGFGGVAFIFSPDPTGMAPLLVAVTMIVLFEGTLTLLRWTGTDSPILAPEPMRARRPYAWLLAALVGYAVSSAPLPTSYYDQLPPLVTETLADLGWTTFTPIVVAVAIVATFEILAYLVRRFAPGHLRLRLWIARLRWVVWIGAAAVGYLASPEPALLESARATQLELPIVAAVVLGIAVVYEVLVQLVVWRRG